MRKQALVLSVKILFAVFVLADVGFIASQLYADYRVNSMLSAAASKQLPGALVGNYRRYVDEVTNDIIEHRPASDAALNNEVLSFRVYGDGEVSDLRLDGASSGKESITDHATVRAMSAATPFNPPPSDCPSVMDVRIAVTTTKSAI